MITVFHMGGILYIARTLGSLPTDVTAARYGVEADEPVITFRDR